MINTFKFLLFYAQLKEELGEPSAIDSQGQYVDCHYLSCRIVVTSTDFCVVMGKDQFRVSDEGYVLNGTTLKKKDWMNRVRTRVKNKPS